MDEGRRKEGEKENEERKVKKICNRIDLVRGKAKPGYQNKMKEERKKEAKEEKDWRKCGSWEEQGTQCLLVYYNAVCFCCLFVM